MKHSSIYNLDNLDTLVIGGAYSVDKEYRLIYDLKWFKSEQPDEVIKERVRRCSELLCCGCSYAPDGGVYIKSHPRIPHHVLS